MKRSEKIAVALSVAACTACAAYITITSLAAGQRRAAMERLLARPLTAPARPQDPLVAAPSQHEPAPAKPPESSQILDEDTLPNLLDNAKSIRADWALEDFVKIWKRRPDEFTEAEWAEGERLVAKYRDFIVDITTALANGAPQSALDLEDNISLDILGNLMLIDAEIAFRRGNDEAGLLRLVVAPGMSAEACGVMNRALPNPIPKHYIDTLIQRLNEFDPKENRAKGITYAALDRVESWTRALKGLERDQTEKNGYDWVEQPLEHGQQIVNDLVQDGPSRVIYGSLLGQAMVDRDVATYLDIAARIRDAVLMPYLQALALAEAIDRDVEALHSKSYYLVQRYSFRATGTVKYVAFETVRLNLPQLGMLIERYRADHNEFPPFLETIVEDLPHGLPIDPFSGQDYIYRVTSDAFVLYSIGSNQHDDNGNPAEALDLLWRPQEKL